MMIFVKELYIIYGNYVNAIIGYEPIVSVVSNASPPRSRKIQFQIPVKCVKGGAQVTLCTLFVHHLPIGCTVSIIDDYTIGLG